MLSHHLVCMYVARVFCLSVQSDAENDSDASSSDDGNPQNGGGQKGAQQKGGGGASACSLFFSFFFRLFVAFSRFVCLQFLSVTCLFVCHLCLRSFVSSATFSRCRLLSVCSCLVSSSASSFFCVSCVRGLSLVSFCLHFCLENTGRLVSSSSSPPPICLVVPCVVCVCVCVCRRRRRSQRRTRSSRSGK